MLAAFAAFAADATTAPATHVYVNNQTGDDTADGLHPDAQDGSGPVRTFSRALHLATPGATIELANTPAPYRETFQIEGYNLGRAGSPLVIEGNGATVSGLIEIPADAWTHAKDDLYYIDNAVFKRLAPLGGMPKSNWLWHWKRQSWWHEPEAPQIFFLNGKHAPHAKTLAAIEPGGFFLNINQHPVRLYFRLPSNTALTACRVDVPGNHGVIINDDHVVIRNLSSTWSSDDGFSTFLATSATFHNVYGAYNCDQGISLHNATSGLIEGGLFEHNGGCGVVDVMNTHSVYIETTIRNNMVAGMWLAGTAHTVQSCYLVDNRGAQAIVCGGTTGYFVNTVLRGQDTIDTPQIGLTVQGQARVDHCTIADSSTAISVSGDCTLSSSILLRSTDALLKTPETKTRINRVQLDPAGIILHGKQSIALKDLTQKELPAQAPFLKSCYLDAPLPADILRGLPADHPLLNAGENRTRLGATIPPRTMWDPQTPPALTPVTIYTHGVGRNKF